MDNRFRFLRTALMGTIPRYILHDLLIWFTLLVVGLTVLMVVILVGSEAWRMNLGLMPTLRLIPFVVPQALVFAVPGTILFTVCLVYGRMSADNEVIAAKSLGIHPLSLLWPAMMLAFLLSAVSVVLNDVAFSWGHAGVQRVVLQSVEEIAYGMLRTQRSYANPRFSIIVKEVVGRKLVRPIMNFQPNNEMPAFTLSAHEAELKSDLERNVLMLILEDCEIDTGDGLRSVLPGTTVQEIPLHYASTKQLKEDSPAHLPMWRFRAEIPAQEATIRQLEQALAAETAMSLVTGDLPALDEEIWRGRRKTLADAKTRLARLRTEPYRRWASGFSCLCFVMVGAPLAMLWRKADVMSTFGLCFGPILFVYYPLLIGAMDRAKAGAMPPYSVWAANLLLAGIGIFLLKRVIRY
ncbi:MAG: LptF/LptG family permease [Pirellulaceae bacterium]|nr:LptF/LptG family permease [Pirellulaceae bacterium]